jgi:Skp family chaperone for outer membrane proteins
VSTIRRRLGPLGLRQAAFALPLLPLVLWAGREAVALRSAIEANNALLANPTAVAVVNVSKVFDKLNESADWQVQLKQLTESLNEEFRSRTGDLERMREELKGLTDPAQRQALIDEAALKQLRLEEWRKLKQSEVDREQALMWQSMYRAIRREADAIAKAEGYQLVLVDDSRTEVRTSREVNAPMEVQARQQIAALRVLYADTGIDITDKVIVRINNASNAKVKP